VKLLSFYVHLRQNQCLSYGRWRAGAHKTQNLPTLPIGKEIGSYDLGLLSTLKWGNFGPGHIKEELNRADYRQTTLVTNEFYYVLWIGWEDCVAYRKGLGRILKSAWDSENTDEIELVLG